MEYAKLLYEAYGYQIAESDVQTRKLFRTWAQEPTLHNWNRLWKRFAAETRHKAVSDVKKLSNALLEAGIYIVPPRSVSRFAPVHFNVVSYHTHPTSHRRHSVQLTPPPRSLLRRDVYVTNVKPEKMQPSFYWGAVIRLFYRPDDTENFTIDLPERPFFTPTELSALTRITRSALPRKIHSTATAIEQEMRREQPQQENLDEQTDLKIRTLERDFRSGKIGIETYVDRINRRDPRTAVALINRRLGSLSITSNTPEQIEDIPNKLARVSRLHHLALRHDYRLLAVSYEFTGRGLTTEDVVNLVIRITPPRTLLARTIVVHDRLAPSNYNMLSQLASFELDDWARASRRLISSIRFTLMTPEYQESRRELFNTALPLS